MTKQEALYSLIWQTRPLLQRINAAVESALTGTGLTLRMRAVLEILHAQGGLTVPALARHLEIQRQYVQQMVNETLAAGLTAAKANAAHARSPLFELTEHGRSVIAAIRDEESRVVSSIANKFSAAELATALSVQVKLLKAFDLLKGQAE